MTDMIKLVNGTEVSADVFYTWSDYKQRCNLIGFSDEQKAKMSASRRGRVLTPDWRAKIGNAHKGREVSAETRAKLSANYRRPWSEESSAKLSAIKSTPVMTPNGLFPSRKAVARAAGVGPATITRWMRKWPEHYYFVKKESA
jgi:hypothetical protein